MFLLQLWPINCWLVAMWNNQLPCRYKFLVWGTQWQLLQIKCRVVKKQYIIHQVWEKKSRKNSLDDTKEEEIVGMHQNSRFGTHFEKKVKKIEHIWRNILDVTIWIRRESDWLYRKSTRTVVPFPLQNICIPVHIYNL
jgi:hypothetical protein